MTTETHSTAKAAFFALLTSGAFVYLCSSFIALSFAPSDWSEFGRGLAVGFWALLATIGFAASRGIA
jgi:hypothetical protein